MRHASYAHGCGMNDSHTCMSWEYVLVYGYIHTDLRVLQFIW
jgi:hypothetical protein